MFGRSSSIVRWSAAHVASLPWCCQCIPFPRAKLPPDAGKKPRFAPNHRGALFNTYSTALLLAVSRHIPGKDPVVLVHPMPPSIRWWVCRRRHPPCGGTFRADIFRPVSRTRASAAGSRAGMRPCQIRRCHLVVCRVPPVEPGPSPWTQGLLRPARRA